MKQFVYFILFFLFITSCNQKSEVLQDEGNSNTGRDAYMMKLLADPATGKIPHGIRNLELHFAAGLPVISTAKRNGDIWKQRGPDNQGGRTRAFAIDADNKERMIAGSATGGIYISTNSGNTWTRADCPALSITCIVQDTRPGKRNIWYAGTGELTGSSGSVDGAYYYGQGIFKSTDGGLTWNVLPSTDGGSHTIFDTDFDGVWNIAIDLSNNDIDEIYAATYGGIYKSGDGGTTWKKKRSGVAGIYSYYTDVAVTPGGVVYATMSNESSQRGIWRSPDGEVWTNITPTGFPSAYKRMCLGIAPSDPDQVWLVATGTANEGYKSTDFLGRVEWNSLWKYNYVSGDGSGSGGRWVNRSQNIPDKGGDFGYYNTQGGYDLFIKVHPTDTNTVFIGATNLWRSKDAYRTRDRIAWIGGYAVNTTRPDFQLYAGHHPDNHHLVFYPDNPDRSVSTHDGGISLTENIMADDVVWKSLSSGYITSQFYTVTLDRYTSGDHKILGGTQDNGTMFMDGYGLGSWHLTFNGDGSYCRFLPDGKIVASAQLGRIARLEIDTIGRPLKYARLDPAQLYRSDYDFINPFVLDPFNPTLMYLPARNRLFRNTDIFAKPLSEQFDSTRWNTSLWVELSNCIPLTGHEISAIAISEANPNVLYYATNKGSLYRVRNANTGQPAPESIRGTAFSNGNINCIALDPLDSNRITVVFSNYGVVSLFTTTDGGQSWNPIAGNLEENPNGSGSGPSCRWAAVMKLANGNNCWFVGTSTGLFATDTLNDMQTRWIRQSPQYIGHNIVTMIDVRRQDYAIAVSTHGNGIYSANIASPFQITGLQPLNKPEQKFIVAPNPVTNRKTRIIPLNAEDAPLEAALYSMNGQYIRNFRNLNPVYGFETDMSGLQTGEYVLYVRFRSGWKASKVLICPE